MAGKIPTILKLLSSAVTVASRAGAEVRRITKTGRLGVVDKGICDYQTEADRTAQRLIVASLSKKFPNCIIVGEEELEEDKESDERLIVTGHDEDVLKHTLPDRYRDVKETDITIWVDPLDGTTEYVKLGLLEQVTVLIGIAISGRSVAGVINQPFYGHNANDDLETSGRTIWGLVGLGCFGITPKQLPNDKLIITTTASHGNINIEQSIQALKPDQVIKIGGAGHKVLIVIEGRAHCYVFASNGCRRWDTCAPGAILESAGGRLTDLFGNPIEYIYRADRDYQNRSGIVASIDPQVHAKVIATIPSEVRERIDSSRN